MTIDKDLSKEYFLDVLSEMEPHELYELLGVSSGIPDDDTDWDQITDSFFEMRWGLMSETDKDHYTAEARERCGDDGVYCGV